MTWRHELGLQIRRARESAGISQGRLARFLGVTRQMVGRYESGNAAPAIDKILRAAAMLKVEFFVHGYRLTSTQESRPHKVTFVPQQLSLDYERPHTSKRSLVRIIPRKGKLIIYAEVPA